MSNTSSLRVLNPTASAFESRGPATRPDRRMLLIDMPFRNLRYPSLGLATLKAILRRAGVGADVYYASAALASSISGGMYSYVSYLSMAQSSPEILFTPHFYGLDVDQFLQDELLPELKQRWRAPHARSILGPDWTVEKLLESIRRLCAEQIPTLLEEVVDRAAWERYDIVGFSLMFDQLMPSLAAAKLIKERFPDKTIVFGGPSCNEEMGVELLRVFPMIDLVSLGEADLIIVPLLDALRGQGSLDDIPGIAYRVNGTLRRTAPVRLIENLDELPMPDYDDYVEAMQDVDIRNRFFYFETSRGCWWGQKHLCSFCGLNANGLQYRKKSAERAILEITTLGERHPGVILAGSDNILDPSFFGSVFPRVGQWRDAQPAEKRIDLFFEMKSNVKKEQLRVARQSGMFAAQPGIESFSDHVLQLMDKGTTGIQQIQFLKWATELRLGLHYGLLWNNPGERSDDYDEMCEIIPFILHLQPPQYLVDISLDRFSPYFTEPARFGITKIWPHPIYHSVFRQDDIEFDKLAYRFKFDHPDHRDEGLLRSIKRFRYRIFQWTQTYRLDLLTYDVADDEILVTDRRRGDQPLRLTGLEADILQYCDQHRTVDGVLRVYDPDGRRGAHALIERLRQRKLLFVDRKDRCLALPVRRARATIDSRAADPIPAEILLAW